MAFKQFGVHLFFRLVGLVIAITAFVYVFLSPRFHVVTLLMFFVLAGLVAELWSFLNKTNREVERFLSAARYGDFNQRFEFDNVGGGFEGLGQSFTGILEKLKQVRLDQEMELRYLHAMVEHIPVPLIALQPGGSLDLLNNAARRFFSLNMPTRVEDLRRYGEEFFHRVTHCKAGEKYLVKIRLDGGDRQLSLSMSEIKRHTGTVKLISFQDIGKELETMQLGAWQDLVRVLTHEIMNSITPVASLAQTTADIAEEMKEKKGEELNRQLDKVVNAASTVALRASNLMKFVTNYRRLTRLPVPRKKIFKVREIFEHVTRITQAELSDRGISLIFEISPEGLEIYADAEQLEQTLINLIHNSEHALENTGNGVIRLLGHLNQKGEITLEVEDNGTGIEEKALKNIFIPYFTTRKDGSGIGLALAKQVMISHGGTISASNIQDGGARFTLSF